MKKILCIDTCGLYYSIALLSEDKKILFEYSSNTPQMQCEELLSKIEEMLRILSISYDEIDAICATNGPGTFNGTRIGTSAAYGISIAKNIEVYGISTLEMILYKTLNGNPKMVFPISVFFAADQNIGFIQTFNQDGMKIISSDVYPQQIKIEELQQLHHQIIKFDVNTFDAAGSTISSATAAGIAFLERYDDLPKTSQLKSLFYGKPPSIN
jgi:tRNA threonylcarbamoyladenosine biosynthesis protein TsaB